MPALEVISRYDVILAKSTVRSLCISDPTLPCLIQHVQSGTHTIACALYGLLRPGDELLSVVGPPYETLQEVIGLRRPSYIA